MNIEVRTNTRTRANRREHADFGLFDGANTEANKREQNAILNRTETRTSTNKQLDAFPENPEQGDPFRGPCSGFQRPGPNMFDAISDMMQIVGFMIDQGFEGKTLLAELRKAADGKPANKRLIVSECERCGSWAGVLAGPELAHAASKVFGTK